MNSDNNVPVFYQVTYFSVHLILITQVPTARRQYILVKLLGLKYVDIPPLDVVMYNNKILGIKYTPSVSSYSYGTSLYVIWGSQLEGLLEDSGTDWSSKLITSSWGGTGLQGANIHIHQIQHQPHQYLQWCDYLETPISITILQ